MSESKPDRDAPSSHPTSVSTGTPEKKPTDATNTKASPSKGFLHAIRDSIPPWVITNIRQRKSQKLLFRSCLASWATLILLLCNPSLRTLGNLYVQANSLVVCDLLCVDRNNSSLVVILGYSLLCLSLQDIRYKSTLSYVVCFKSPATSFNNSCWDTACPSVSTGATDWLGHRICRDEVRYLCALFPRGRGYFAKCRQVGCFMNRLDFFFGLTPNIALIAQ
jgi:hypothetical protein